MPGQKVCLCTGYYLGKKETCRLGYVALNIRLLDEVQKCHEIFL